MDSSTKWRSGPTSPKESSCPPRFQMGSESIGTAREVSAVCTGGYLESPYVCCLLPYVCGLVSTSSFFAVLKPSVCIAIVFVDQI